MKKTEVTAERIVLVCGLCFIMAIGKTPYESLAAVPKGLSVGGQDISGLELEAAEEKAKAYAADMAAQSMVLSVEDNKVEAAASDLGISWVNGDVIRKTVEEYETGNIIERYFKQKDLEMAPVDVALEFQIESAAAEQFVTEKCAPFMTAPVDAQITRENGVFTVTPSQDGTCVDWQTTEGRLKEAVRYGLSEPVTIEVAVMTASPSRTEDMLATIQDVLGTFSTDFSSSSEARATNLQVGSGKLNGAVLMPGETLSGYESMQPFTRENGYASASAYENGQVVDSIGGGVCQIATTLYNAALLAELDITQRQNHSMIVTYVPPSRDAAIAGTYKDIKITNPYDTPIYVEAGTSGRTLTFTIYGKETRPAGRTVEYVSETLSTTNPGAPVMQYDSSLKPGAQVKVQSSHTGRKSQLWKCVYMDGKEVERTLLHTDTYEPSPAVYRVGPSVAASAMPIRIELNEVVTSEDISEGLSAPGSESE